MKKLAIFLVAVTCVGMLSACGGKDQNDPTETTGAATETTETAPEMMENLGDVNGIPLAYASEKEIDTKLNDFEITPETKYADIVKVLGDIADPAEDITVAPGKVNVIMTKFDSVDDMFTIGVKNLTDAPVKAQDANVVFVGTSATKDFTFCGLKIGMTKDEVKAVRGEPTVDSDINDGYSCFNYFTFEGENSYALNLIFDQDGKMTNIDMNINNTPLYEDTESTDTEADTNASEPVETPEETLTEETPAATESTDATAEN